MTLPHPTLIFFNGILATQNPQMPLAQAVAVVNKRILAVGTDTNILSLAGPDTKLIDLDGRLMVPGFIDTHFHFYEWAIQRQGVHLEDAASMDDLLDRVSRAVKIKPPGQWIMGQGFNETAWPEARLPSRDLLDRVSPDHPVLLWRCDLHLAVANSAALTCAGIDTATPDPPEGRIERDHAGRPNGVLRELAINLVRRAVPLPSDDEVQQAFTEAITALHQLGITGIHDTRLMDDQDGAAAFRMFQRLNRDEKLHLRTWVSIPGERLDTAIDLGLTTGFGDDYLRVGHVKFFSDGGMGARTAWMIDPYRDGGCGMPLMDMKALAKAVTRADAAGLSTMVHAIGDRANREVIGIFEELEVQRGLAKRPAPKIPHRIEHLQMIRPEDVARLNRLTLALNVSPANLISDIDLIDHIIGEMGQYTYALRPLADSGLPVMFGSDCPVCDPDPLVGIRAAITRRRDDGTPKGGWHPQNRITVSEAIRAYTAAPAAVYRIDDLGVIAPGNKADLAILSQDMFGLPADKLPEVKVTMTIFDGEIVYRQF